jgi:hypothetical protein
LRMRLEFSNWRASSVMASKCQSRASFDKEPCLTKTFLLWPDSTEAHAQTNLRRELHNLREALPEADRFVDSAGRTLHWRADAPATVDLIDFEACLCAASAA